MAIPMGNDQSGGMYKRIAASLIWIFAVAWRWNLIGAFTGLPQVLGVAVSAGTAAFVAVDPLHLIWPVVARSAVSAGPAALDFAVPLPSQSGFPARSAVSADRLTA